MNTSLKHNTEKNKVDTEEHTLMIAFIYIKAGKIHLWC